MKNILQKTKKVFACLLSLALVLTNFFGYNALAANNVIEIYSLSTDSQVQGLEFETVGEMVIATPHLDQSGDPTYTIVEHPEGGNSIEVAGREETWYAVDLARAPLNLQLGNLYTITIEGRVPDLSAPADTQVIIGGSDNSLNLLAYSAPNGGGSFTVTLNINHMILSEVEDGFRFQTNNTTTFIIDEIIVNHIGTDPDWTPPAADIDFLADDTTSNTLEDDIAEDTLENDILADDTADDILADDTADDILEDDTADDILEDDTADDTLEDETADDTLEDETADDTLEDETADDTLANSDANLIEPLADDTIYSLAADIEVQGLSLGTTGGAVIATPHLTQSGSPNFTIVEHPLTGNSIEVSNRSDTWHTMDLERAPLNLQLGNSYTITVTGRIPDAPAGTQFIIGGPVDPWSWLANTSPAEDGSFTVTLNVDNAIMSDPQVASAFRLQTNNSATYIIDEIIVNRIDGDNNQEEYEIFWTLAAWLEERGFASGAVLPWTDDAVVRNAGSVLTVQANNAVEISNRDADWNGMDVRFELYPGDLIEISGSVPTPVPSGMQIRLQRLPGYGDFDTFPVAEDGTFTAIHVVTEDQSIGSQGFRINTNAAGANIDILIADISVSRLEDSEPIEPPPVEIPPVDLPRLDDSYLENYVLRVEIPAGNQWDGLRLNRAEIEPYLTPDGIYEFSFDLFTPQSPAGVGLMLQTNGPRWAHLLITPNYPHDNELYWTRFDSELEFEGRPNLVNPSNILSYDWTELQLVKRGSGSGGVNDGSMVVFFIDNFTITNTVTGEVAWSHDFEEGIGSHGPFTGSPASVDLRVVPIDEVGEVDLSEPEFDLDLPSLARECFAGYDFLFGNIWSNQTLMSVPNTEEFFLNQFNAVTAENHHKPDHIAPNPNPDTWDFTTSDLIVDWAEDNDLAMIGHTLIWHGQSPLWMTGREGHPTLPLVTRAQAIENMYNFISIYAGRYAGRIHSWDVLNEVFTDSVSLEAWEENPDWRAHLRREGVGLNNPDYLRWYDAFSNGATSEEEGSDFIFYAFYFARQTDPNAILYYNDFNEEQPGKSRAMAQMVVEINERWAAHPSYDGRLLIEVIGMQSHHHLDQWATNFDNIRPAMIRFIETGARISVTELDITIGGNGQGVNPQPLPRPLPEYDQQRLAAAYGRVLGYYLEFAEYMNRISIWGLADTQSWRAWGQPLLFDGDFQAKPAFWAVCDAVANIPSISQLDAPTNLEITDDILTWDEVENAVGYRIYVRGVAVTGIITNTSFDLATLNLDCGIHRIQVRAIADEGVFLDSLLSESIELEILCENDCDCDCDCEEADCDCDCEEADCDCDCEEADCDCDCEEADRDCDYEEADCDCDCKEADRDSDCEDKTTTPSMPSTSRPSMPFHPQAPESPTLPQTGAAVGLLSLSGLIIIVSGLGVVSKKKKR